MIFMTWIGKLSWRYCRFDEFQCGDLFLIMTVCLSFCSLPLASVWFKALVAFDIYYVVLSSCVYKWSVPVVKIYFLIFVICLLT